MNINKEELKEFVENNPRLVLRKQSKRYPNLFILRYTKKVFYDNLWNQHPLLLECRGLVVDKDYNVIIKPFTKVFNYLENNTIIKSDEICQAVRKVNGFLGVVTYDPTISTNLIYSTTGSLDSDFTDLVRKHVEQYRNTIVRKCAGLKSTLMFEICDESDPHIIEEQEGAWLIGAHFRTMDDSYAFKASESKLDLMAEQIGCLRPEQFEMPFSQVCELSKTCHHEGYMVYGLSSGTALKIKSPYYLVTKFIARASETKLMNTIFSGDRNRAREKVSEEFFPLIDYLMDISEDFKSMEEQQRIKAIKEFLEKRE